MSDARSEISSLDTFLTANTLNALIDEAFAIGLMQIREEIFALAAVVGCLRPLHVLEIGAGHGGTFFLWCKLAGDGWKISVDLPGGVYGGEPNADQSVLRSRNNRMRQWASSVHLISGDSRQPETVAEVRSILNGEKLDLLFIDGNHAYEFVSADYRNFREFVATRGCIVFHDINDSDYHRANGVGVPQLWAELTGEKLEINARKHWGGIGLLRV